MEKLRLRKIICLVMKKVSGRSRNWTQDICLRDMQVVYSTVTVLQTILQICSFYNPDILVPMLFKNFIFLFFKHNLLRWHWLTKLHRFQEHNSIAYHYHLSPLYLFLPLPTPPPSSNLHTVSALSYRFTNTCTKWWMNTYIHSSLSFIAVNWR